MLHCSSTLIVLGDVGHVVSLVSLLAAALIFTCNESLHCGRVSVHLNMFLSFILSNISWLVWNNVVLPSSDILSDNNIWCKAFNLVMTYFTTSTYFWMLCEGLYLQMLLVNTFDNDKNRLKLLMVLGWGLPAISVVPYGFYQTFHNDVNCWMDLGEGVWFIGVPVLAIMVVNVLNMFSILIIIRSKRSPPTIAASRPSLLSRSSVQHLRPLFVLAPVLGLQFLLVPARPQSKSPYEYSYDLLLTMTSSFQGMYLGEILCLFKYYYYLLLTKSFKKDIQIKKCVYFHPHVFFKVSVEN